MSFEGKTVLVVGSTPFAQEVRAAFAAAGALLLNEAVYGSCDDWQVSGLDVLVDVGGKLAAKPFLSVTADEWRGGLDADVVRAARYARMVLPAMLLANRGVVVFLLSPRGTEAPWEGIHQEVTLHARRALAHELKELVNGSEVAVASISRTPEGFAEGSLQNPRRQSRRLDAGEFIAIVAGLARTDTPGS